MYSLEKNLLSPDASSTEYVTLEWTDSESLHRQYKTDLSLYKQYVRSNRVPPLGLVPSSSSRAQGDPDVVTAVNEEDETSELDLDRLPNDPEYTNRWVFPYPKDIWDAWINRDISDPRDPSYIKPPTDEVNFGYAVRSPGPKKYIYPRKYLRLWDFIHNPASFLYPQKTRKRTPFPRYTKDGTFPGGRGVPSLCPPYLPDIVKERSKFSKWQHTIPLTISRIPEGLLDPTDVLFQQVKFTKMFGSKEEGSLEQYDVATEDTPDRETDATPWHVDYSAQVIYPNETSFAPMPYPPIVVHNASTYRDNGWFTFYRQKVERTNFPFPNTEKMFNAMVQVRRMVFKKLETDVSSLNSFIRKSVFSVLKAETRTYLNIQSDFNPNAAIAYPPEDSLSPEQQDAKLAIDTLINLVTQSLSGGSVMYRLVLDEFGDPVLEDFPYKIVVVRVSPPQLTSPLQTRYSFSFGKPIEISIPPFADPANVGELDFDRNIRNLDWVPQTASAGHVRLSYPKESPHYVSVTTMFPGSYLIHGRINSGFDLGSRVSNIRYTEYHFNLIIYATAVVYRQLNFDKRQRTVTAVHAHQLEPEEYGLIDETFKATPNAWQEISFSDNHLSNLANEKASNQIRDHLSEHSPSFFPFAATLTTSPMLTPTANLFERRINDTPVPGTYFIIGASSDRPVVLTRSFASPYYFTLVFFSYKSLLRTVAYFGQSVNFDVDFDSAVITRVVREPDMQEVKFLPHMVVASPHYLGRYSVTIRAGGAEQTIFCDVKMADPSLIKENLIFDHPKYLEYRRFAEDSYGLDFGLATCQLYGDRFGVDLYKYMYLYPPIQAYVNMMERLLSQTSPFNDMRVSLTDYGDGFPVIYCSRSPRIVLLPHCGVWVEENAFTQVPLFLIFKMEDIEQVEALMEHIFKLYLEIINLGPTLLPIKCTKTSVHVHSVATPPIQQPPPIRIIPITPPPPPPRTPSPPPPPPPPSPPPKEVEEKYSVDDQHLEKLREVIGTTVFREREWLRVADALHAQLKMRIQHTDALAESFMNVVMEWQKTRKDEALSDITELLTELYIKTDVSTREAFSSVRADCVNIAMLGAPYFHSNVLYVPEYTLENGQLYEPDDVHLTYQGLVDARSSLRDVIGTIFDSRKRADFYRSPGRTNSNAPALVAKYVRVRLMLTKEQRAYKNLKFESLDALFTVEEGHKRIMDLLTLNFYEVSTAKVRQTMGINHLVDRICAVFKRRDAFVSCVVLYSYIRPNRLTHPAKYLCLFAFQAQLAYKKWKKTKFVGQKRELRHRIATSTDFAWLLELRDDYIYNAMTPATTIWPFFIRDEKSISTNILRIKTLVPKGTDGSTMCDLLSVTIPEVGLVWTPTRPFEDLKKLLWTLKSPPETLDYYDSYNSEIVSQHLLTRHLYEALFSLVVRKEKIGDEIQEYAGAHDLDFV